MLRHIIEKPYLFSCSLKFIQVQSQMNLFRWPNIVEPLLTSGVMIFCTSKNEGRGISNVPEFCRHIRSKRLGTLCNNW